jgi:hypothetical protein
MQSVPPTSYHWLLVVANICDSKVKARRLGVSAVDDYITAFKKRVQQADRPSPLPKFKVGGNRCKRKRDDDIKEFISSIVLSEAIIRDG